eukprot:m.352892 g.352892  ORF g.352892 m.352892 type:complete len:984 (+) comp55916_c0_seq1:122-3073(+)
MSASADAAASASPDTRANLSVKQRIKGWFSKKEPKDASSRFAVENLEMIESIGEGSFATVVRAQDKRTGVDYAIKMINLLNFPEEEALAQIQQEQTIMELVSGYPLIVKLFHTWTVNGHKCFALEYIAGGDLFEILKKERKFSQSRSSRYVLQLGRALEYLHSKGVVFRDLKLENILLESKGDCIRLADFGLAKILTPQDTTRTVCGTVQYMAPEIILNQPYDTRVDWWSLGVITYVFLAGKYPFNKGHGVIQNDRSEQDRMIMYRRILDGVIEFPEEINVVAADVVRELLHTDPALRLHGVESLEMQEWFVAERQLLNGQASHFSPAGPRDLPMDAVSTFSPVNLPASNSSNALSAMNANAAAPHGIAETSRSGTPSKSASMGSHSHASDEFAFENFAQTFILNHMDEEARSSSDQRRSVEIRSRSPFVALDLTNDAIVGQEVSVRNETPDMSPADDRVNSAERATRPSSVALDRAVSFFSLLERVQGSRLDEQRSPHLSAASSMSMMTMDDGLHASPPSSGFVSSLLNNFRRKPDRRKSKQPRSELSREPQFLSPHSHASSEADSLASKSHTANSMAADDLIKQLTEAASPDTPPANDLAHLLATQTGDLDSDDILSQIPELSGPVALPGLQEESPDIPQSAASAEAPDDAPTPAAAGATTIPAMTPQGSGSALQGFGAVTPSFSRGMPNYRASFGRESSSNVRMPLRLSQARIRPTSTARSSVITTLSQDSDGEGLSRSGSVSRVSLARVSGGLLDSADASTPTPGSRLPMALSAVRSEEGEGLSRSGSVSRVAVTADLASLLPSSLLTVDALLANSVEGASDSVESTSTHSLQSNASLQEYGQSSRIHSSLSTHSHVGPIKQASLDAEYKNPLLGQEMNPIEPVQLASFSETSTAQNPYFSFLASSASQPMVISDSTGPLPSEGSPSRPARDSVRHSLLVTDTTLSSSPRGLSKLGNDPRRRHTVHNPLGLQDEDQTFV